jgi:signal peptidase I
MGEAFKDKDVVDVLNRDGILVYKTKGISMKPMLRTNRDVIFIRKKKDGERFRKYDTVLFQRDDGRTVLHRITKVAEDHYLIRGDNCFKNEYVREDQVLGILEAFMRNGKHKILATDFFYRVYSHVWVWIHPLVCLKSRIMIAIKKMLGMELGPIPE